MMWYDKRPQDICDRLNADYGDEIYRVTGMYARPMFSAPKMRWLKENYPAVYEQSHKLAGIQDYLIADRRVGHRFDICQQNQFAGFKQQLLVRTDA